MPLLIIAGKQCIDFYRKSPSNAGPAHPVATRSAPKVPMLRKAPSRPAPQ